MARSSSRKSNYALSSASNPVLKSLGLEEVDPEDVFEIQNKEGAGAFGRVFRAYYKCNPSKLAALKVIPVALEAGQRGEDIENVRKEIQFLRECDHPNVVAFYGAYYKDGALWVAMEYCGGGSVGDVSRHRRVQEHEIAVIMRGALHGLAYLHSKKKIHRDIKGGNILLTSKGQVKIADFGVSAQLRDTMSRRGTFVGTPYWMSPEMIQDSDYDYKSDIWSLGITAIELADQKPPLFDEHPMRVLIQIPRNPSPQLKTPSAWSPQFSQFLQFCLEKDPKERPTALECLEHSFIRAVDHIEWIFSKGDGGGVATTKLQGKEEEEKSKQREVTDEARSLCVPDSSASASPAAVVLETGESKHPRDASLPHDLTLASTPARDPPASVTANLAPRYPEVVDDGDQDEGGCIAEDISRLDDDTSDASDDDSVLSSKSDLHGDNMDLHDVPSSRSSSRSSSSSDGDDERDSAVVGETFNFRQPAEAAVGSTSLSPSTHASVAMISGDELLQLSVCESVELPSEMKILPPQHSPRTQSTVATAAATNGSQPPTEFKLLPTVSTSPLHKSKKYTEERFRASTDFSIGSNLDTSVETSSASLKPAPAVPPQQQKQSPPPCVPHSSVITTAPRNLSSVSSSWQNPLSELQSSRSRVNVLLNSISSSPSTRLFTKLLQDEGGNQRIEQDLLSDQNATPRVPAADERNKSASFPATTSTTASTRLPRSSLSTSGHFVGAPFRVAHDVCVTFNSVEARFEGAPLSEEWVILHEQFGIPLAQMRCCTNRNDCVPALLHMLRRELVKRDGLVCKYIYRVSPDHSEVQSVRKAINSGSVEHTRVSDPHVYASLIKQWLRELPSLLLSALDMRDLRAIAKLETLDARRSSSASADLADISSVDSSSHELVSTEVARVLGKLPQQERAVLDWLLDHMLEVVEKSSVNKMTAQSLAVVMAPNLFSCENVSTTLEGLSDAANCIATFLRVLVACRQRARGTSSTSSLTRSRSFAVRSSQSQSQAETSDISSRRSISIGNANMSVPITDPSTASEIERPLTADGGILRVDAVGSLEDMVKAVVDGLWIELEARKQVTSVDAFLALEKREASDLFGRFQHSIVRSVQQFSKRPGDREWATKVRTNLENGASLQPAAIPSTLRHLKRWMKAALCFDDFVLVLRAERATKDKLERVRKRYPMECGVSRMSTTGRNLDPAQTHALFRQIFAATLDESRRRTKQREEEEPAEEEDDDTDKAAVTQKQDALLDGAFHLVRHIAETEKGDSEISLRAEEIAKSGEREPTIGNLLAGVSRADEITRLHLETQQQQLADMVQSSLRIHELLQRAV